MSVRRWLTPRSEATPSSTTARILRLLLMSFALWVVGWNLTSPVALCIGTLGVGGGLWLGERLGLSRLRLWTLLLTLGIIALVVGWLGQFWTIADFPSRMVGSVGALQLSECWMWGWGLFLGIAFLRLLSTRVRPLLLVEMWLPLLAGISLFSSHRGWNLHRPQDLADWAILRGVEPISVLMMLGAIGAVFLAMGLLRLRKHSHLVQGMALVLILLFGIYKLFDLLPYAKVLRMVKSPPGKSRQQKSNQSHRPPPRRRQMPFRPPPQGKQRRHTLVAVVLFEHDFRPPSRVYYFRQRVMSHFNGIRLVQARKEQVNTPSVLKFPDAGKELKYKEPSKLRKKVKTLISLITSHKAPFALGSPVSVKALQNGNPRLFMRQYAVTSKVWEKSINTTFKLMNSSWSPTVRKHYLNAPTDPRYKKLLKETILQPLVRSPLPNNTVLKAYLIKTYLEKHYTYILDKRTSRSRDQVAEFLFGTKKGYCVHFAHAAVYLLRLAGIPARLAEGYAVPERFRGNGSSVLIREREAHAWPEIYVDKVGWIAFDIYPRQAINGQLQPPDPKLRKMMAELARQKPSKTQMSWAMGDKLDEKQAGGGMATQKIAASLRRLSKGGGISLLVLIALVYLLKFWRRWGFFLLPGMARYRGAMRSMADRLSEAGLHREAGETPQAFAERIELPALKEFSRRLEGLRLGSQVVTPEELSATRKTVESQMWKIVPWWIRLLRLLDPISWSSHIFLRWRQSPPGWWKRWKAWRRDVGEKLSGWSARRREANEEASA